MCLTAGVDVGRVLGAVSADPLAQDLGSKWLSPVWGAVGLAYGHAAEGGSGGYDIDYLPAVYRSQAHLSFACRYWGGKRSSRAGLFFIPREKKNMYCSAGQLVLNGMDFQRPIDLDQVLGWAGDEAGAFEDIIDGLEANSNECVGSSPWLIGGRSWMLLRGFILFLIEDFSRSRILV
jgi:hypothetical protein